MRHPALSMKKSLILFCPFLLLLLLEAGCSAQAAPANSSTAVPDLAPYPWVYLRDEAPLGADEAVVSVIAAGDVLLGRGVTDETDPLRHAAGWLQEADLTLGNLEGVLVDGGSPRQDKAGGAQPIILAARPSSAQPAAAGRF